MIQGAFDAGVGQTELNKILTCLDIPTVNLKLYSKYEKEVGPIIEKAARQSCRNIENEERKEVMKKIQQVRNEL